MSYTGDSTSAWSIQVDRFDMAARVEAYYDTYIQSSAFNLCHTKTTSQAFRAIPPEVHFMVKKELSTANYSDRSKQWARYRTCRHGPCAAHHHMESCERKQIIQTLRMMSTGLRRLGAPVASNDEFWAFYDNIGDRAMVRREAFHGEYEKRVREFSQSAAAKHFAQTFTIQPHLCTYTIPSDFQRGYIRSIILPYWLHDYDIDLDNQSIRPGELATWKAFLVLPRADRRGKYALEWKENVHALPLGSALRSKGETMELGEEDRRMFQHAMAALGFEGGEGKGKGKGSGEVEEIEGDEGTGGKGEGMVPVLTTFAEEVERPEATSGMCGG